MADNSVREYKRALTPIERFLTRSPYSIVTMVARIRGHVTEEMLRNALARVRQRHPNLRARIIEDEHGSPWLTSEGAQELQVQVVPREADDHWMRVVQESSRMPFEFDVRPAIRFLLVQSASASELIILCHHVLCDGLSLAYLARDLMMHLGDPAREAELLPDPVPIDRDNMPPGLSPNPLVRLVINGMNKRWAKEKVLFDQADYVALTQAYWNRYPHQIRVVEWSEAQTSALVERCRKEEVTVNSALAAAFVGAQAHVQDLKPHPPTIAVAASVRDRLPRPAGEVMGFYAGLVNVRDRYDPGRGFWDNARDLHRRVRPLFTDKNLFENFVLWCYLEPSIIEAIHFKKLGGLLAEGSSRYEKLAAFAQRDDVVLGILKRDKMESLQRMMMGTAVTNLARMDFPRQYGALELERLIMKPGAGFPLVQVNLVLGAVTCAGKLSLVLEFVEDNITPATVEEIEHRAMEFLTQQ